MEEISFNLFPNILSKENKNIQFNLIYIEFLEYESWSIFIV